ncbi:triacylglycerol lipase OBL1 isoform X1 [Silene latifolia]|uniref:triacylglycerol lipase OBL1 isoform X1 n=1 Tax=Silene latifolia TaxID=37657 RepID=UPI003D77C944
MDEWKYLILRPETASISDLWKFWRNDDYLSGSKFIQINLNNNNNNNNTITNIITITNNNITITNNSSNYYEGFNEDYRGLFEGGKDHRWVIVVSVIMMKLLRLFSKPLKWFGYLVDFLLNLFILNGDFLGFVFNLLQGKLILPQRETSTFISAIGHLDGRINLYETDRFEGRIMMRNKSLMDLCIMASKLAYENVVLVKEVVVNSWKMHFVDFYNGWNEYHQQRSTQVFIFCDKPVDANLIIISFRGTEPFDTNDWSTDFDYSWYEIPGVGKIHLGFLEALGLGNRNDTKTFQQNLQVNDVSAVDQISSSDMGQLTAYHAVRTKLKELLAENSSAKFVVTGHSLGGALAILFPIVLVLHGETEMLRRLFGVYTFGQPRIGDRELGRFMKAHLCEPEARYFRVVYCNDGVPRIPYDDKTFLYKHFGECLYYNSFYSEQKVDEKPNKNLLGLRYLIPAYMNAVWELIRGLTMHYMHGLDFKENWVSILVRIVGLALPGLSAHSPRDYVNSVRLGAQHSLHMSPLE